ncbi:MAG: hypothetical protein ACYC2I_07250 [Elusimicrobiales bacterium]
MIRLGLCCKFASADIKFPATTALAAGRLGPEARREKLAALCLANLLSSEKPGITESSVGELEYQAEVAGWIGADVINIHGGGAYGDKKAALARAAKAKELAIARLRKQLSAKGWLRGEGRRHG